MGWRADRWHDASATTRMRLPADVYAHIKRLAVTYGLSPQALVERLVDREVREHRVRQWAAREQARRGPQRTEGQHAFPWESSDQDGH